MLSTYGIPQIQTRVGAFAENISEDIAEVGIVVSKYRSASTVHQNTVSRMEGNPDLPPVFEVRIPEANATAASAEWAPYGTLRQKYGYGASLFDSWRELTKEFIAATDAL